MLRQLSHRPLLASRCKYVVGRLFGQREGTGLGEGDGGFERGHDVALDRLQTSVVERTLVPQLPLEQRDRILLLPRLDLCLVAGIGLPLALRVGALAVGLALDQRRAAARPRPLHGADRSLMNSDDVVAVDREARNAVSAARAATSLKAWVAAADV